MAAKTLTARQSIEAAFEGSTSKKLKTSEILAHVEGNRKSAITPGTVRTQLQVQSTKGVWIKRVAPGTYQLVKNAPAEGERKAAPRSSKTEDIVAQEQAEHDAKPDPKPGRARAAAAA